MAPPLAKETVGVMGSGSSEHDECSRAVGELLARLGVNLLTGGGRGTMAAVSRAFTRSPRKAGICIGVVPCSSLEDRATPKPGYPNEFVELAIYTHLPYSGLQGTDDLSRNHINVLSCAAIVALPGEHGTATEVSLALRYGKPVIAFSPDLSLVRQFPDAVPRARTIGEVEQFVCEHVAGVGTGTG